MPWELTGNSGTNPATNFIGTTDNQPLVIRTNGAEALRIQTPSGGVAARVGIGTTDLPGAALEIVSDGAVLDPLRLRTTNPKNPRSFRIGPNVGAEGIFGIYDDDARQVRLSIDYSGNVSIEGNVGIGTSAPGAKLVLDRGFNQSKDMSSLLIRHNGDSPISPAFVLQNDQGGEVNQVFLFGENSIPSLGPNREAGRIYANWNGLFIRSEKSVTIEGDCKIARTLTIDGNLQAGEIASQSGFRFPDGSFQTTATLQGPPGRDGRHGGPGPQGPQGLKGDKGDPGRPGVKSSAVCGPNPCEYVCGQQMIAKEDAPCQVTSETGGCLLGAPGLGYRAYCCVCA